ncbi:MAG: D-alanine--D-alanine ligase family protein [bacterium]
MKIGFCYDIEENHPLYNQIEESTAEYESEETISWMAEILGNLGQVIKLPWHQDIFNDLKKHSPDVVFNITESWGTRNRESFVPNICEILGIPYTGSDGLALGVSLDKTMTKHIVNSLNIPTPGFFLVNNPANLETNFARYNLEFPLFVKPNNEGSSMGIKKTARVKNKQELENRVQEVYDRYKKPVLVEEFLPGREFTVSMLGNGRPQVFPIAEILTGDGEFDFYAYEFKDNHDKTVKCPAPVSEKMKQEMVENSLEIFSALDCRDLARVDFKLDKQGQPSFIEINPLPGLSPFYSIYPFQAEKEDYDVPRIIEELINFALKRKGGEI